MMCISCHTPNFTNDTCQGCGVPHCRAHGPRCPVCTATRAAYKRYNWTRSMAVGIQLLARITGKHPRLILRDEHATEKTRDSDC